MKLSLVVPCFNEQDNVQPFYEAVENAFHGIVRDYEIVFVNDGSTDKTAENLKVLYNYHQSKVQVLTFSRNFGKEAAIYAGLSHAKGDLVCIIDADLQQRPEIALQMVRILEETPELDCVAAFQEDRKESAVLSWFKSMFYKVINAMTTVPFTNGASDFRTFRTNVRDAILQMGD